MRKVFYTALGLLISLEILLLILYVLPTQLTVKIDAGFVSIVTAIATILAVFVALFGKNIRKIFIHTDIKIIGSRENQQIPNPEVNHPTQGHTRLIVKNLGKCSAYDVEAYVTKIIDPDSQVRPDFLPVPLSWTHDGRSKRNFHPNQYGYLDLCRRDDIGKQSESPKLVLAAGGGVFNYEIICEGDTELELTLFELSGNVKKYNISLTYNLNEPTVKVSSISEVD